MSNTTSIDYKKLLQSFPAAVIVFDAHDPDFTILEENEAHAAIANVTRNQCIGRPLLEAFPDTSEAYVSSGKSELLESIRRVKQTAKPDALTELRYDIKNREGIFETRYWSVTHYPVIDDGNVVAIYQVTQDTTQQALALSKVASTAYQLEQIMRVGNVGTWVWDIAKERVTGDENTAFLFGIDPAILAAGVSLERAVKAIYPDDRARVRRVFREAVKKNIPYECEYRTIDGRGDVHWVVARGYFDKNNQNSIAQSPGVLIDVTERKRAEENLNFLTGALAQFSASLGYKKILRTMTKMVVPNIADWCSIDLVENGELQQVALAHKNPEKVKWAEELRKKQGAPNLSDPHGVAKVIRTGEAEFYPEISPEMLADESFSDDERALMKELDFRSAIIAPMTIDGKTIGALTFVATESRLHYKPADVEVAKTLANRAALAVYNATLYDEARRELAYRRELQDDLELLNSELEYRVEVRTKELQATNDGLQREIKKRQQAEKVLDTYSKELARSNQELQDFAYVASHDLQEPLRKIQAFGDLLESESGDVLEGSGKEYLARMRSAASRMSTLIEDLLSFSRVATKQRVQQRVDLTEVAEEVVSDLEARIEATGGAVEVGELPTVWADQTHMRQVFQNLIGNALKFHRPGVAPVVKVYAAPIRDGDTKCTIHFEDNGIGFDEKYLDRIFSVFQRLHGKEEYEGTGVGLAVCRKIAERYNGTITAVSKKGSGSTFSFTIPVAGKEPTDAKNS